MTTELEIQQRLDAANEIVEIIEMELYSYREINREFQDSDLVTIIDPEDGKEGIWQVFNYNSDIDCYYLDRLYKLNHYLVSAPRIRRYKDE